MPQDRMTNRNSVNAPSGNAPRGLGPDTSGMTLMEQYNAWDNHRQNYVRLPDGRLVIEGGPEHVSDRARMLRLIEQQRRDGNSVFGNGLQPRARPINRGGGLFGGYRGQY